MEGKLKWYYDKKHKEWYVGESVAYAKNGLSIKKELGEYKLTEGCFRTVGWFKKLSSAKQVAYLLRQG